MYFVVGGKRRKLKHSLMEGCWLGGGERFPTASSLPHGGDLARWGNDNITLSHE